MKLCCIEVIAVFCRIKRFCPLTLLVGVLVLSGCGLWRNHIVVEPESEDAIVPTQHGDLVAMNLIFALSQLNETRPLQTTVQITEPRTEFGRTIEKRLEDAGYGVQRVSSDIGSNYIRYQYQNSLTEAGPVTRYSMSIGFIKAERNYIEKNGAIFPDSEMMISGAADVLIKNNDSIFADQGEFHKFSSDTFFEVSNTPEPVLLAEDEIGLLSGQNNFAASIRKNIHDNDDQSNFAGVFENYADVRNVVLIFPNDKFTVGVNNKKVLRDIAKDHNPETDIFSVIGCSHGKTNLVGGNVALATGRAQRVKEELILSSIPYEQIYEEGCWGNLIHGDFPDRGVVVTLKRRRS